MFTVVFKRKKLGVNEQKVLELISERIKKDFSVNAEEFRSVFGVNAEEFGTIAERLRNDCGTIALDIYILVGKNPNIKTSEFAKETTKSIRTVEYYISKLKKSGFIERKGPKLGGYWKIINNRNKNKIV